MGDKVGKKISEDDEDLAIDDDEDIAVDDEDFTDTVILSDSSSDDDDDDDADATTAEVNVERLMAELEKTDHKDAVRRKEIRRRLEELAEEKSFEDTYAFEFDND